MSATSLSLQIAARYVLHSERRFARLVSWISFGGLFLGVLVLTTVVSVMNGFDAELKTRLLGSVPHVMVVDADAHDSRFDAVNVDGVLTRYAFYTTSGMVAKQGGVNPVAVFAADAKDARQMTSIAAAMVLGDLGEALSIPAGAVLGAPLANRLGLSPGDPVLLMVSQPGTSGVRPRLMRLVLTGMFELGAELDYQLLITRRDAFSSEQRASTGSDGVRVQLADPLRAPAYAQRLREIFQTHEVLSWTDSYGELFDAVRLEKAMMFLILLLVVAVAGFNIVSGQTMMVHDKRADIAILRTMGASNRTIRLLFLWQGVTIATLAIATGLAAGVLLAINIGDVVAVIEQWLGMRILEGTYFLRVPSRVIAIDVLFIGAVSWVLCLLAAWLPVRRAAAENPVEALHGG
ncbi:MAG: FtsX-like permease family protein [Pseudomonadales bacterium]|jgi:lipoprotein-releasing system permease protein|nr:FtsX-like permease family protein [Pseudomonadales bacterium]MDP6826340.1 FtsX-like permease family protein [Pseudomonadales bacterium]MDP6973271.1 FtsX-like permease family protein [Pseudomonadales bacterium]